MIILSLIFQFSVVNAQIWENPQNPNQIENMEAKSELEKENGVINLSTLSQF